MESRVRVGREEFLDVVDRIREVAERDDLTLVLRRGSSRDAIEDIIEPYLIQQGFIQRTPRGRVLAANAWRHLGLEPPRAMAEQQISLFQEEGGLTGDGNGRPQ